MEGLHNLSHSVLFSWCWCRGHVVVLFGCWFAHGMKKETFFTLDFEQKEKKRGRGGKQLPIWRLRRNDCLGHNVGPSGSWSCSKPGLRPGLSTVLCLGKSAIP